MPDCANIGNSWEPRSLSVGLAQVGQKCQYKGSRWTREGSLSLHVPSKQMQAGSLKEIEDKFQACKVVTGSSAQNSTLWAFVKISQARCASPHG